MATWKCGCCWSELLSMWQRQCGTTTMAQRLRRLLCMVTWKWCSPNGRRMVTNDGKKHRFSCPIRRGLGRGASIGMPTYANPPRGGVSQSLYQQSTCSCCTFLFDFFKLPNYSQGPDRLKGPSLPQAPHVSDPRRDPTRETRSSQCGPAAELELFGHPKLKNGLHGVRIK